MSATIEIPSFWVFRKPCGCIYGSLVADQRFNGWAPDGAVITTAGQAWDDFYDGEKRRGNSDKKAGNYLTAEDELPPMEQWAHKTFVDGVCTVHTEATA